MNQEVANIVSLHEQFLHQLAYESNPNGNWAFTKMWIPVDPASKGRHRSAVVTRGGKSFVHNYQSDKDRSYEATVREVFSAKFGHKVIEGASIVGAVFLIRRPNKYMRKKDPEGPIIHTAKPDVDNLVKALMDSIQHYLGDDKQVFSTPASKYYAPKGETGGMWVILGNDNGLQPKESD